MSSVTRLIAAGVFAAAAVSAPAAAQYQPYPEVQQPYPQEEQQYPQDEQSYPQDQQQYPSEQGYPQDEDQYPPYQQYPQGYSGYGYGQTYSDPVGTIIDQLLGRDSSANDRQAARQCAAAALAQAQGQSGRYGDYGGDQGYGAYGGSLRVSAITGVERSPDGLEVRGRLSSGYGAYGNYGQADDRGDVSFRCNVDYRGAVTDVRLDQESDGY